MGLLHPSWYIYVVFFPKALSRYEPYKDLTDIKTAYISKIKYDYKDILEGLEYTMEHVDKLKGPIPLNNLIEKINRIESSKINFFNPLFEKMTGLGFKDNDFSTIYEIQKSNILIID